MIKVYDSPRLSHPNLEVQVSHSIIVFIFKFVKQVGNKLFFVREYCQTADLFGRALVHMVDGMSNCKALMEIGISKK